MRELRRLCIAAIAVLAAAAPASAQRSGPVLSIASGAASRDLAVPVDRAVVLETGEAFSEVSVANPDVADVAALSNTSIYVLGKRPGRTTLTLLGAAGRLIANVTVRVEPDVSEFKTRLQEILPDENIEVRTANDGIVLSGAVSGAAKLSRALALAERYAPDRVINMMSVAGTQQVLLKVRFAEVQRSASKSLGFNWSFGFGIGNWGASASSGDYLAPDNLRGTPVPGGLSTGYQTAEPAQSLIRLGYAAGGIVANLAIDALESRGAARTLAEPNLVALSGDAADFLAGGEYPVPVTNGDGDIVVEYRPFGISLGFTPTVVDRDRINLQLTTESSAIDTSIVVQGAGVTYNGFSVRRANTTIELRDGQSFAIAGLLTDRFIDNASQLPWIGDVPILGTLFRSADYTSSQTELVIIVTAHLVAPTTETSLALPTDRIAIPSEAELFLFGRVEGNTTLGDVASQGFAGDYGYVME